ncbi:MAG: hypothetical protein KGL39_34230 [Patescibacteria group bacterium]|nr:hypothetical protein [Patescibacteria group bacterium]
MTVRDLLDKVFRTLHVNGAGDVMDADQASDALDALNGVIEQANIDKLLSTYQTTVPVPMVSNQFVYTIGPASTTPNITATRPVEILSGYSRRGNIDIPLFIATKRDYDLIINKSVMIGGWESTVYYEATFPKGTLYFYPIPNDTATTVYLNVLNDWATFLTLDDVVSFPPGYRVYLQYKTAKRLAPEYGMPFTPDMESNLVDAEAAVKRNNIKPLAVARSGVGAISTGSRGAYNVYSDTVMP